MQRATRFHLCWLWHMSPVVDTSATSLHRISVPGPFYRRRRQLPDDPFTENWHQQAREHTVQT